MKKNEKKQYEAPSTKKTQVETESCFMITSGESAKIKKEESKIEVEDYDQVFNEVTFE